MSPTTSDRRTGPFSDDEIRDAINAALDDLAAAGDVAVSRAELEGLQIVLRGQTFVLLLPDLAETLAKRLQDA